ADEVVVVLGIAGDVHGDVAGSLEPPRHAILHLRLEGAEHGRPAQPGLGRVETVVELLGAERAAGVRERPRDEDTLRREAPPARAAVEDYQPAPEDAKKVASAKVILINGLALDRWSEKLRKNAAPDAKVVILSDDLPRLGIGESDDEDINKNGNPHYWLDVKY